MKIYSDITFGEFHKDKAPLNKESAKHLLLSTKKVLKNIPFILCYGTLFGAYMDSDFIEYDTDIDVAVFCDCQDDIDQLIKDGRFATYGLELVRELPFLYSMKYKDDYIDIYFFVDNGEFFNCDTLYLDKTQITDGLTTINFMGEEFKTVNNIEKYLIEKYGAGWVKPLENKHAKT